MNIRNLGGHSGCTILLCEDTNGIFVRKISSGYEYNVRLKKQSKKQAAYDGAKIKTPAVLDSGYTYDGLFYFDMEYIAGITLAEYMKTIEIGKIRGLVESIVNDILPTNTEKQCDGEVVFVEKIKQLKNDSAIKKSEVVDKAFELLTKHYWGNIPRTQCHGDMTFENIIVKNEQLYFLDFLDSFYDSWILDASTLLQDCQSLWAYRYQNNIDINTLIRLTVFRDILIDNIRKENEEYLIQVYYALLLKLIRIYPYVTDDRTYAFLDWKILDIINILKRGV